MGQPTELAITAKPSASGKKFLSTVEGTQRDQFEVLDWSLLLGSAIMFGASFLFIAIGLDSFAPGVITFGRIGFGFLALGCFPSARRRVEPADWPRLLIVGFVWMGVPLSLFPIAQQHIDSAIAGMLNGATPIAAALVATVLLQRLPGARQIVGIIIGFVGILLIGLPSVGSSSNAALGVSLILGAVLCYGVALNIAMPLLQKYGSVPILWRAQAIAAVLTAPAMLNDLGASQFAWKPLLAIAVLGVFGTGLGFVAAAMLSSRVGPTRASVLTYIATPVAILLGLIFRNERLSALEVLGALFTLVGAWFASRSDR